MRNPAALLLFTFFLGSFSLRAQNYDVGTGPGQMSLRDAILAVNQLPSTANATITIDADSFAGQTISMSEQLVVFAPNLIINGNGVTIDMGNSDRAFYLASGNTVLRNLTIANGRAQGGDGGRSGGGGGMGAGGAIFVANLNALGTVGFWPAASLTIDNVTFFSNSAAGGSGSGNFGSASGGGGGGMGGDGGGGYYTFLGSHGGGGGGGFGNNAYGGFSDPDSPQSGGNGVLNDYAPSTLPNVPGANGAPDSGGDPGGTGGSYGGGGGGANSSGGLEDSTGGGGGYNATEITGGYGGGGGGGDDDTPAGNGGFGGGGGGGGTDSAGGSGGFGGGGGGGGSGHGEGGFGGGKGDGSTSGGGGMGAGGAIFVADGATVTVVGASYSNNNVSGGSGSGGGSTGGSAIGDNYFLGGDLTYTLSNAEQVTLSGLGGAGGISDPNVAAHASDPNAQGGLGISGNGTLTLTGTNTYTGPTTINESTLVLSGTSTSSGYTIEGNGTLDLQNSTTTDSLMVNGATVTGIGSMSTQTATFLSATVETELNVSGAMSVQFGPNTFAEAIDANQVTVSGGSMTANGSFTANDLTVSGGDTTLNSIWEANTVEVSSGSLEIGASNTGPATAITQSGGSIAIDNGATVTAGAVVLNGGSTTLSDDATLNATTLVMGATPGSISSLTLQNSTVNLASGNNLILGQGAGSASTLTIGNGGAGADLGFAEITTGAGSGVVNFSQNAAKDGAPGSDYYMLSTISGNITVNQNGPGTTILQPFYSSGTINSYTGGTNISSGTLLAGNAGALPENGAIAISGGTLDTSTYDFTIGSLAVSGGTVTGSGRLITTGVTTTAGTIDVVVHGSSIHFVKNGSGQTTLTRHNTYTGTTTVNNGALEIRGANASALVLNAGSLVLSGNGQSYSSFTQNGGSAVISGTGISISGKQNAGSLTIDGSIAGGNIEVDGSVIFNGDAVFQDFGVGENTTMEFTLDGSMPTVNLGTFYMLNSEGPGSVGAFELMLNVDETVTLGSSFLLFGYTDDEQGGSWDITINFSEAGYAGEVEFVEAGAQVEITAVPEPTISGLMVFGALAAALRRRRRSRR